MANYGGTPMAFPAGFSIGTKGYFELGMTSASMYSQDFWEWDQASNTWTQKANLPGPARWEPVGFSIGTKGYIGTGNTASGQINDFWEWDQPTNTWTQKSNMGGPGTEGAAAFSIGAKGYIGTGTAIPNELWEWDQATNTWTQKANIPVGRYEAVGFSIGNKGYIGTGGGLNDFWEWDQLSNTWTQKANLPGPGRYLAVGFSIGNKGYIGTGATGSLAGFQDFYEWDQATNNWIQQANVPAPVRFAASGFSIGCKGYIGTGSDTFLVTYFQDFWEWCPNPSCCSAALSASIFSQNVLCNGQCTGTSTVTPANGTSPYTYNWSNSQTTSAVTGLCAGTYSVLITDASSATTTATTMITQPATALTVTATATSASCGSGGSANVNASGGTLAYTYSWNPGGQTTPSVTGLSAGNYTATVTDANGCTTVATVSITGTSGGTVTITSQTILCNGDSAAATAAMSGGTSPFTYTWSGGQTTSSVNFPAGNYSVTVTDASGCSSTQTVAITQPTALTASTTATNASCGLSDGSVSANANGGTPGYSYMWNNGQTTSTATGLNAGNYSVTITDANGCSTTFSVTVANSNGPTAIAGTSATITSGSSANLTASGGVTYSWSNGMSGNNISVSPAVTTEYCVYVFDASLCSDSACVTIYVDAPCEIFYFPNAFSPNGDNENDVLKIYPDDILRCISDYQFVIYDRWGEKLFSSIRADEVWDGMHKGKIMDTQVLAYYLHVLFIDGKTIDKQGNVSLVR